MLCRHLQGLVDFARMSDDDGTLPCVEVIEGRSKGKVFVLDGVRSYVVGRLPGAEIHISDPGVSRRHVKLSRHTDGRVVAADMRSTNGLIVNGDKLERHELRAGDEISLGPDAVLRFCYRDADQLAKVISATPTKARRLAGAEILSEDSSSVIIRRPKLEEQPLSPRQLEVSQQVAKGLTNAEIAAELGISPRTVTSHLDHIYSRLGIGSRAALTRWLVEHGLQKD